MGIFSFLKRKKPETRIPVPPSPPGSIPKPFSPDYSMLSDKGAAAESAAKPPIPPGSPVFPNLPVPERSEEQKAAGFQQSPKDSFKSSRHVDDFGIPSSEDFDLPDIEMPQFRFPSKAEKSEIKEAIQSSQAGKPLKKAKSVPEELPEIGEKTGPFFKTESPEEKYVPEELPEIGEEPRRSGFDEYIEEPVQLKELPKSKTPVFIRGDMFMMMKKGILGIKDNLKNMDAAFAKMTDIKNREEADIDVWHSSVEAIQRKMVYIDRTVFEK